MANWINPFDFQTIFVNTLSGTWTIFIFIILIAVSYLAGRFRLNDRVFVILLLLFGITMAPQLGGLYVLMIIITGLATYYGLAKVVKQ